MDVETAKRKLPIGAEVLPAGGVHFRVWAPRSRQVELVLETTTGNQSSVIPLASEDGGYYAVHTENAAPGILYRYRLDGSDALYPDPASRFQPEGPHGPSCVVDPASFHWSDQNWPGASLSRQVVYEMHIGTFTEEGTWEAASRELPELAEAGITVIEMMPVADFPGRFGWGYDGVNLFAPTRLYGEPDDLRRFVDRAHAAGIAVILDVVYNHLGPDGNYLKAFSEDYFTDRYENEWGDAINFDGAHAGPVRAYILANARYWIEEFHFDGLRLDATQQIFDRSEDHILASITRTVREAARGRATILIAENEPQHVKLVRPLEQGGFGIDGLWNDDLHHSAMVALTGRNEAYYSDHRGTPQELISAAKWGYLYQGQWYAWQQRRRGTPAFGIRPETFVTFIQNHDQVANSAGGLRCHQLTSPGRFRAMTAFMLLLPGTPMLFQGQEFAASSPFLYFADHKPDLAETVSQGRASFLSQFPSIAAAETRSILAVPHDEASFRRSKLDFSERDRHREAYALHRDLLRLRREDPVFRAQRAGGLDGAVLAPEAFALRFFAEDGLDRLLLVNLGSDLLMSPIPEPLLAPPENMQWSVRWSSEHPRYGGSGTPPVDPPDSWRLPGHAAIVLVPTPIKTQATRAPAGGET